MPRHRMQFHVRPRKVAIMATEAKPGICPYCFETLEAVTGVSMDGDTPRIKAGCYSVCAFCRELMGYDGKIFVKVSPEEAAQVMVSDPLWGKVRDMRGAGDTRKPDKVQ